MTIPLFRLGRLKRNYSTVNIREFSDRMYHNYGSGLIIDTPITDCSSVRKHLYSVLITDSSFSPPKFRYVQIPRKKSELIVKKKVGDFQNVSIDYTIDSYVPLGFDEIETGSDEYEKQYYRISDSFSRQSDERGIVSIVLSLLSRQPRVSTFRKV